MSEEWTRPYITMARDVYGDEFFRKLWLEWSEARRISGISSRDFFETRYPAECAVVAAYWRITR